MIQTQTETIQAAVEQLLKLTAYWPELAGILTILVSLLAARQSGKTKQVRKLSYKLENRVHRLLDSVGLNDPERTKTNIKGINSKLPSEVSKFSKTHSDGNYFTTTPSEMKGLLRRFSWFKYLPYRHSTFDCEQFARLLKVLVALRYGITSVGVVTDYKAGHAYNIFITTEGAFYVEPQEMKIVRAGETHKVGSTEITYLKQGGDGRLLF